MKLALAVSASLAVLVFGFITGSHLGVFIAQLGMTLLGESHPARIVSLVVAFGTCYVYGRLLGSQILSPILLRLLK